MFQIRKPGFPVKSASKARLKYIADLFRQRIAERCGNYGNFCPIARALEMLGTGSFARFSFAVLEDSNPKLLKNWACTSPSEKCIYISQSTYEDACNDHPQARFTIAHEFGHLLLEHEFDPVFARENINQDIPPYKDSEWQADTFAAYVLMPAELAKGKSADEIEKEFGVSASAARARVDRLRRESQNERLL
jgi:hypothetical protein